MTVELTKLKALKNNVFSFLKGRTPQEQLRPTAYYDPSLVGDLFTRFKKIRDDLITSHPDFFQIFLSTLFLPQQVEILMDEDVTSENNLTPY